VAALNRIFLAASLVCAALVSTSVSAKPRGDDYIAGCYVTGSPTPQLSSISEARFLARKVAVSLPGAFVVKGQGRSMQPLYCDNTLLVVQPKPFTQLERGMSVVFRTKDNRSVTHVLVAKSKDGWRTIGLNNRRHDATPVTAQNLQGVVVAAYTVVDGEEVAMR
jgi:hypothetical protein